MRTRRPPDVANTTLDRRQQFLRLLAQATALLLYFFLFYLALTDNFRAPAPDSFRASLIPSFISLSFLAQFRSLLPFTYLHQNNRNKATKNPHSTR